MKLVIFITKNADPDQTLVAKAVMGSPFCVFLFLWLMNSNNRNLFFSIVSGEIS